MWKMTSVAHFGELSVGEWKAHIHNFGFDPIRLLGYQFQIRGRNISDDPHPHGNLRSTPLSASSFEKTLSYEDIPDLESDSSSPVLPTAAFTLILLIIALFFFFLSPSSSPSSTPSSPPLSSQPTQCADVCVPFLHEVDLNEEEEEKGGEGEGREEIEREMDEIGGEGEGKGREEVGEERELTIGE